MKSCRHWKLLAAALLAISTTEVTAQDQGRALAFRTGGESPNDPTYLLASKSVQKELALTDSQKASFQKLTPILGRPHRPIARRHSKETRSTRNRKPQPRLQSPDPATNHALE
jgi:hypothetical protein